MLDVRAIVELLLPLSALLPRVETAIRDGGGIGSAEFQAALGMTAEQVDAPMYEQLSSRSGSRATRIFMRRPRAGQSRSPRSDRRWDRPAHPRPAIPGISGSSASTSIAARWTKANEAVTAEGRPISGSKPSMRARCLRGRSTSCACSTRSTT